jgi:hypothetical protein
MLQYHKKMNRTCSTPKRKITRNVLGSERERRIEGFMTTRFADRPLGEVGGVSRNRLLVDKMIVWRTILGLIMASKWPAPESRSACHFQRLTPRARDRCKQTPAMHAPTPRIPRLDFINWAMSMAAACDSAADLPRVTRGRLLRRCDERKVRSCMLRIILWHLFIGVEILPRPSRWS